ncbi:MAG: MATE family efflux transporter [Bacteroidaceae bacterium]|nr:MATE family efflux transporter [Bacteroidaceae bacterium]
MDMLHGPLQGKIIRFAIPIALSSVLTQLFNTVDVAVVGRFASSTALAAVGANTFIINLLINLFFGVSIGSSVVIANHIGQNNAEGIRRGISTTAALSIISGVLLLIIGMFVARPLLQWMDTPADVLPDAERYLRIFLWGSPFLMIYTFGAAILRSRGDSKRPLYILVVAGIINTVLNLVLVIRFHMGVAGVAIGTGVSNMFSALVIIWLLRHEKGEFQLHLNDLSIHRAELRRILAIGLPAGLQGMTFSLSNIFIQSSINSFGSAAIAGSSVAQTLEAYSYFFMAAFTSAATTFVGQNYGAGLIGRCKRITWICLFYGAASCFICNLLFTLFAPQVLGLFTPDPGVIRFGRIRIEHVLIFQCLAASYDVTSGSLRGVGHSIEPTVITIFGTCVLRLVWVFWVFPVYGEYHQLLQVYPITWVVTGITTFLFYIAIMRRLEGRKVFPVRALTLRVACHLPRPVKRLWSGKW